MCKSGSVRRYAAAKSSFSVGVLSGNGPGFLVPVQVFSLATPKNADLCQWIAWISNPAPLGCPFCWLGLLYTCSDGLLAEGSGSSIVDYYSLLMRLWLCVFVDVSLYRCLLLWPDSLWNDVRRRIGCSLYREHTAGMSFGRAACS